MFVAHTMFWCTKPSLGELAVIITRQIMSYEIILQFLKTHEGSDDILWINLA